MSFLFLLYVSLHQQFDELWHEIETIQPPQLITYAAQHGGHVERRFHGSSYPRRGYATGSERGGLGGHKRE